MSSFIMRCENCHRPFKRCTLTRDIEWWCWECHATRKLGESKYAIVERKEKREIREYIPIVAIISLLILLETIVIVFR